MVADLGLVGHAAARRALLLSLQRGTLAHALLLTGEAGIGKRRFAEWLVAARWCEAAARPCGACTSCRKVESRNHPDLLVLTRNPSRNDDPDELGSRHEITVEQVRSLLIPWLGVRPIEGRGRAVIIDGADTLNEAAQNALLKTLEEPPRGCLLLLVTSHEESLLDTLRSRCQDVRLLPLDVGEMAAFAGDGDDRRVALAAGRPGRLAQLRTIDIDALLQGFDAVLAGELPGTAFARRVQELLTAGAAAADNTEAPAGRELPEDEPDERQRLAAELLLARLVERLAAGEFPEASLHAVQAAQSALLELGPDLHRHIPPAVAWSAAGTGLATAHLGGTRSVSPHP